MRGSPDGYVNSRTGFGFADACACLLEAFAHAQKQVLDVLHGTGASRHDIWLPGAIFGGADPAWPFGPIERLAIARSPLRRPWPVKVGLILVGKRHKATRQMILEAAAGAVLHQPTTTLEAMGPAEFVRSMGRCRIVGFDLAGHEPDFPPSLFTSEFERLSRLHIPMTVHAGENAGPQFVEDAVLELRARRIGHGLSVVEDPRLLARIREDDICIELCPTSNYQTNSGFSASGEGGRPYPLTQLLRAGVSVCINTDNPGTSWTNIVKEYFKASESTGRRGLTLWDALRLVRTGFAHAFVPSPEREAMLDVVDQILFDLFSSAETVAMLSDLLEAQQHS
jgi:adenosine deaminase